MVKFTVGWFFITFCGAAGHYFMTWIYHFLLLVSLLCAAVVYTSFFGKLLLNHAACILSAQVGSLSSPVKCTSSHTHINIMLLLL